MKHREIDRKIAELMGYGVHGDNIVIDGWLMIDLPQYSTDWNAMRLLVEWLQGRDFEIQITSDNWGADVSLFRITERFSIENITDKTIPLAFCKAVLALPANALGPEGSDATEPAQAEEGSD